jgi:hypothetical protein
MAGVTDPADGCRGVLYAGVMRYRDGDVDRRAQLARVLGRTGVR